MLAPTPNPFVDPLAYAMEGTDEVLPVAPKRLDWPTICRIEPRLAQLQDEVHKTTRRNRTWTRWSEIKRVFIRLVGWHANNPRLRTVAAYDLTYSVLLNAFEDGGEIQ